MLLEVIEHIFEVLVQSNIDDKVGIVEVDLIKCFYQYEGYVYGRTNASLHMLLDFIVVVASHEFLSKCESWLS